jgi:Tfp pilus assembly protein PilN
MTVQTDGQAAEAVTVSGVDWAPVPRVNLLPQEILDARGFRRVQVRLGLGIVLTLLLAAAGVLWAQSQVGQAQDALDATTAQTTVLQRQQARYAEVPRLTTALASAKAARAVALNQDVLWYRLMSDVALATPTGVYLTTMNLALSSGGTSGQAAPSGSGGDPLVPAGIGTVSVSGTAGSYPDVAAWLEAIVRVPGLDGSTLQNATLGTTTGSSGQLTFSSQIVIDSSSLSHRYDSKAQ